MKKLICLISLLILLAGCNAGNSENNENNIDNKSEELVQEELAVEKDYEHLQKMVEFYDNIVDDGLPYGVKSLAKNLSECEEKCESQYMTYEDAKELVETEAYDAWFAENYEKPTPNQVETVKESCPIEITSIYDEPDIIGNDTLNIVVKNNGTEAVKYFEAFAVFWDNNGYPLKSNFGYDEVVRIYTENPNLTVGESTTWSWQPYVAGDDFGKAEVFISKVELYDGTVWTDSSASSKAVKRFSELNK